MLGQNHMSELKAMGETARKNLYEYVAQMYGERAAALVFLAGKKTKRFKYRFNYHGKRTMRTCSIYSGTLLSLTESKRPQRLEAYSPRALLEQVKGITGNNPVEINGKTYRINR